MAPPHDVALSHVVSTIEFLFALCLTKEVDCHSYFSVHRAVMTAVNGDGLNIQPMFLGQFRWRLTGKSKMSLVGSIVDADGAFKTRSVDPSRPNLEVPWGLCN